MKHFTSEEWADFSRGILGDESARSMERHLDNGCAACSKESRFWSSLTRMALREREYQPPETAVRFVKALYGIEGPRYETPPTLVPARLVFDSFDAPLPAGMRAMGRPVRQLVFEGDGLWVDLKLEPRGRDRASLMGQVLQRAPRRAETKHLAITVVKGGVVEARTVTNRNGEFHTSIDAVGETAIDIETGEGRALQVRLHPTRS